MHAFYRQINKKGKKKSEVAIDFEEFRDGMKTVVHSKASDSMLWKIYKRMDVGDDHLGDSKRDKYLTYKEFATLLHKHQQPWNYDSDGLKKTGHRPAAQQNKYDVINDMHKVHAVGEAFRLQVMGEGEEDYNGDVLKAEKKLATRMLTYLKTSSVNVLFREFDRSHSNRLHLRDWVHGTKAVLCSRASTEMLTEIFKRMDRGDDHLGANKSDRSIDYKEFSLQIRRFKETWRPEEYWRKYNMVKDLPVHCYRGPAAEYEGEEK
eukprot:TRINITY_DN1472_c0_g1_i4.p1 TRINITY_DN1472_c0_g1~~TRINITY_DN1472_c0_g1_i4.p1  ORF type:complete len:263 (-),score=84.30 TRINITY_DN1472_c0_g1_i4:251-1039(-)